MIFEADTLGEDEHLGIFITFTEDNVRAIGLKVIEGRSSIEMMPSWSEVKRHEDFKIEALSLKAVRINIEKLPMSKQEVKALIEHHGTPLWDGDEVPGHGGPSMF